MGNVSVFVSVIIENDKKFALVQEGKLANDGIIYNLPSGKIELGETIEEAALREAAEETGLNVQKIELHGIYQRPLADTGRNMINIVFAAPVWEGDFSMSSEHPEVRWCSFEEVIGLHGRQQLRVAYIPEILGDFVHRRRPKYEQPFVYITY